MTSPFFRRALVAAALLAPALAPRYIAAQEPSGIAVGAKAPGAAVEMLDGRAVDLASFLGRKPVVMEFWATWCPLCRKLEPQMKAMRAQYVDRVTFVSVGVPQNQTPERQLAHVTKEGMTGEFVFDRKSAASAAYKVPHTSYVVVVDAKGTVVYTGVGADQDLAAAIGKAFPAMGKGTSH
ncbi:MAG TPA: TlpA disulfide reductase family protein [Gemmatimonas sp.]|nr:TlpA disulfide reductase family protein [Gemmatimonas sp.]